MHLDHNRISHILSVLEDLLPGDPAPAWVPDSHDRDRFPGKNRGQTVVIMNWPLP
jgi:hypothetical protein